MPQFEELLAEIERKRRGRLWLTAVPVAAALVLLAVTVWQVAEARRELFRTQREIADRRQELERVQRDLNQKKKELDFLGKAIWNAGPQSAMQAIGKAVDAEPALAQVAGRIYLHIRDENQRPKAREIGQKLRSQGYIVPGIERVRQGLLPARCGTSRGRTRRKDGASRRLSARPGWRPRPSTSQDTKTPRSCGRGTSRSGWDLEGKARPKPPTWNIRLHWDVP
jgi:hypothetical protein